MAKCFSSFQSNEIPSDLYIEFRTNTIGMHTHRVINDLSLINKTLIKWLYSMTLVRRIQTKSSLVRMVLTFDFLIEDNRDMPFILLMTWGLVIHLPSRYQCRTWKLCSRIPEPHYSTFNAKCIWRCFLSEIWYSAWGASIGVWYIHGIL